MRTPEVEAAMKRSVTDTELVETKTPPWNRETLASVDRRTLAAEIERLEAELAKSDEAARAAMYAVDERAFLAECAETSVKRAEAAEARVRELEAQNARLRGDLEYAEAERLRLTARRDTLDTQIAALTEKTTRLKEVLVDCHAYLMRRITLLTLNESASDTTQSLARDVSVALDALDDGKAAP
jgi:chromosome segregation ATPase